MLSHRCNRCWNSFDSRRKRLDHHENETCEFRVMFENERFMSEWQEGAVNGCTGTSDGSNGDIWWQIFELLFPGVKDTDWRESKRLLPCTARSPGLPRGYEH
jgi:hypothetical protein